MEILRLGEREKCLQELRSDQADVSLQGEMNVIGDTVCACVVAYFPQVPACLLDTHKTCACAARAEFRKKKKAPRSRSRRMRFWGGVETQRSRGRP